MASNDKLIVHYIPPIVGVLKIGHRAMVHPVDHTSMLVSNLKIVLTSNVVSIGKDGMFETKNSIYEPVQQKEAVS